jgi:hypothetical protein
MALDVVERIARQLRNAERVLDRQGTASLQAIPERFPLEILHREVRPAGTIDIKDLEDPGVIQRLADLNFTLKSRIEDRIAFERKERELQGDRASVADVDGFEHRPHAATIDELQDGEPFVDDISGLGFRDHAHRK